MHYMRLCTNQIELPLELCVQHVPLSMQCLLLWRFCRDVHGWTHARRAT